MSRDLNKTTPRMRDFANKLILKASDIGINVFVIEVDRPYQTQVAYYAQGRDTLESVNKLRKRAGLSPITESENKKKITWTMNSRHIVNLENDDKNDDYSHAIDFGIKDNLGKYVGDSKADVNKDNKPDYIQLGKLAKEIDSDIIWGGDWVKNKDYPHYEEPKNSINIIEEENDDKKCDEIPNFSWIFASK